MGHENIIIFLNPSFPGFSVHVDETTYVRSWAWWLASQSEKEALVLVGKPASQVLNGNNSLSVKKIKGILHAHTVGVLTSRSSTNQ